ncbi:unnamed protein product [Effrenium voratum]|uniref:ABC transporter domain-containing protein n=1 Tax=Effrenium voratum TaxID=2562239 RepID=A0AA36IMV1_9DINO|nr:unnamed protein product [Effrenium voratum]
MAFSSMGPAMAMGRRCALAWLLLACAAAQDGGLERHQDPKKERQSKVMIVVLLLASVLVICLCYAYQRFTKGRDQLAAVELKRLQETDSFLQKILSNASIQQLETHKFRGITRKLQTATLEFRDIKCTVKSDSGMAVVLDDLSGSFLAGHLSAIMGPSGSGKTTFIDVLTGKKHTDSKWTVTGDLLINGEKQSIEYLKPVIGFVPQDDTVHEGLTVRENITFSAMKRMPAGTKEHRIRKITDDVMQVLQLESKQNMIVGNRVTTGEGLSGGQRKRVNIGLEIAACPTILFLDEPTSGLDSNSSLVLVQQLKRLAKLGMTIVMIIHQPRYSLFTLLDDVVLLGTGGHLAYIGPTLRAKPYFERLGLIMPENENPADWMMDILCGEIDQQYSRIQKAELPAILFEWWRQNPHPGNEPLPSGLRHGETHNLEQQDRDCIKQHLKDHWAEVARGITELEEEHFAKVLKSCTGATPSEEVAGEIMRRVVNLDSGSASTYFDERAMYNARDAKGDPDTVRLKSFIRYMLAFRGISAPEIAAISTGDSETEQSSDEDRQDEGSGDSGEDEEGFFCRPRRRSNRYDDVDSDLIRTQAGFCTHLQCTLRQSMLTFWRTMEMKMLFLLVICFAAAFLAVFDRFIFESPTWMPTTFLNAQIALALLVSVYCLQVFSVDQPMYWREASHGLNRCAFLVGRALVDTLDWCLLMFFFVLVYYVIAQPLLTFIIYMWPFVLVAYVASGWGYAISCCLPTSMGAFISAILAFAMGGILGLPMQMGVFLNGGIMEILVDCISFTRWSVPMGFLASIEMNPPDPQFLPDTDKWQLTMYEDAYRGAHFQLDTKQSVWWTAVLVLILQGSLLRVVAYLGLRFTNRDRQI